MGRKGGKYKRKENNGPVKKKAVRFEDEDMMNDEIDVFHKQRDVVPLNVNEDSEESDEDTEQPVFDFENDNHDEDDEDKNAEDDRPIKGLAAKIVRTQKFLEAKFGKIDDEMLDDAEEEEEEKGNWGRKEDLYGTDVVDEPQSSDDEDAAKEEEKEVLKLQTEKAKAFSFEDYGIEDDSEDETDREPTFEDILDGGKPKASISQDKLVKDDTGITYTVKKDLNTLTKEEQMNIVKSSAPELEALLSELSVSLEQLENKVNPLLDNIGGREIEKKGGMHYLQVKQLLLQSYCQAITFYLLLKSEGLPVRDHPVVSRLVDIRSLIDKMKEMDKNLPFDTEDIVKKDIGGVSVKKLAEKSAADASDTISNSQMISTMSPGEQPVVKSNEAAELITLESSKKSEPKSKPQDQHVGVQSMEMLKVRAALEEKLKQKGVLSSIAPKNFRDREKMQPVNRQLETLDDFDDEAMEIDGIANGRGDILRQLTSHSKKRKVLSGDADIPQRDDLGERRRKHELRVLAGAGIRSSDGAEDGDAENIEELDTDSDLEYYKKVEKQHAAKRAAKSDKYSRTPEVSSITDDVVDGKRQITYKIEKNRGLTRSRKKETKNPRKKYKLKHKEAEKRRKGQVRAIRKPDGSYGGESTGINPSISRSVRFKS